MISPQKPSQDKQGKAPVVKKTECISMELSKSQANFMDEQFKPGKFGEQKLQQKQELNNFLHKLKCNRIIEVGIKMFVLLRGNVWSPVDHREIQIKGSISRLQEEVGLNTPFFLMEKHLAWNIKDVAKHDRMKCAFATSIEEIDEHLQRKDVFVVEPNAKHECKDLFSMLKNDTVEFKHEDEISCTHYNQVDSSGQWHKTIQIGLFALSNYDGVGWVKQQTSIQDSDLVCVYEKVGKNAVFCVRQKGDGRDPQLLYKYAFSESKDELERSTRDKRGVRVFRKRA